MRDRVGTVGDAPSRASFPPVIPYILLAVAFLLIAYYGTAIYNFFIPTVVQRRDFSLGIWALAVIAGVAGFLSPCAFGMLPAYFAFFLSVDRAVPSSPRTPVRAFRAGLATAAGMVAVAVVLAIVVLSLGATFAPGLRVVTPVPNQYTRGLRIAAGVLLIVLGVLQWRGWSIAGSFRPGRTQAWSLLRDGRTASALVCFQFGILYVLVALPCVANVMAAPLLAAAATYGLGGVVVAAGLFLLTMATLMVATSVLIGLTDQHLVAKLRGSARAVLRVASVILIAMGFTLIYLDLDLGLFRRLFFQFPIR